MASPPRVLQPNLLVKVRRYVRINHLPPRSKVMTKADHNIGALYDAFSG